MSKSAVNIPITAQDKTQQAFRSVKKSAYAVTGVLAGMGAAAATAVAAFSVQKTMAFDAAISDLSAITGATGSQLQYLEAQAKTFGSTTTLSASEAADAFKLIASAKPDLLDNAQALSQVTGEVIKLAEASGVDLAFAADAVGASLNQFGAEADQAARFVNVLAAGSKFGSSSVNDTATALKNAGTVAAGAGLSFEETNASIQTLAKVGIKGGEAGTGLRGVLLKLSTQAKQEFNPEIVGMSTAMKNLADAHLTTTQKAKLFGAESLASANALIQEASSFDALTSSITATNTAMDQSHTRNDNLAGDLKALESAAEGAAISFGSVFTDLFRDIAQAETEGLRGLTALIDVMSGADEATALALQINDVSASIVNMKAERDELLKDRADSWLPDTYFENGLDVLRLGISNSEAEVSALIRARNDVIEAKAPASPDSVETGGESGKVKLDPVAQAKAAQAERILNIEKAKHETQAALDKAAKQAQLDRDQAQAENIFAAAQQSFAASMEASALAGTTESEQVVYRYDAKLVALEADKALLIQGGEDAAVIQAQFDAMKSSAAEQLEQKLYGIKQRGMTANEKLAAASATVQTKTIAGMLTSMTASASTESRAMFEINKAASLVTATIKGVEAVQSSYAAGAAVAGPIGGAAMAAVAVAATAANLQKISSTSFGGGGKTGSAGSGGASIPSQALNTGSPVAQTQPDQAPAQTVNVYFQGNVMNEQYVNEVVVPMIQDGVTNGDMMLIAPDSANAQVLAA
ncbi:MAG: phage tail tape measure protein [Ghiorsea sp.]